MLSTRRSKLRHAISSTATIAIVVIVIIIIVVGAYAALSLGGTTTTTPPTTQTTTTTPPTTQTTTTPPTTQTTTTPGFTYGPKNSSILVDDSCQTGCAAPDSLDPQYAFFAQDDTYLSAVFQDLAVMNGTDGLTVLPVESTGWTVSSSGMNYTFNIRPNVYFSNGDNLSAYTVWFSYVREIYINAPSFIAISNWNEITENTSGWFATNCGNFDPWGLVSAVSSVEHIPLTPSNCGAITNFLNNMLSNYNPATNATQAAIVSYPHQAYVAPNSSAFQINTLRPYGQVVLDLAGFSGTHTSDPAFVDAHGGVQNNTASTYLASHCEPGTGPYMCVSVASGLSEMTLEANPHYWAAGNGPNGLKPGLPWVIQPAHIPVVEIEYGIGGNPTLQYNNFGTNVAAMSSVGISQWNSMWAAFQYKQYFSFNNVVKDYGPGDFSFYLGMNTQSFPTNMTNFRLAVVNALNYTQLADTQIYYNGTAYGSQVLGPGIPPYGALYNPDNVSLQTQNINLAAHYLDLAGKQAGFYTVMPNGTVLGDSSGKQLQPLDLYYIVPLTPSLQTELTIYQDSLAAVGIPAVPYGITSAVYDTLASDPTTAPNFNNIGWGIDYPDPFYNQYLCFFTTNCGIATYINNATLTKLVTEASFSANQSFRLQVDKYLYQVSLQQGYYAWLPYPDLVMWVQPYVQGIYNNIYVGFFYNTIYYKPVTVPSS
ncbi:MAG: ABC transporter substrate-binding protein [Thaumarchaeota archaeon]|nr:ABC transporter substrate-binding protein [Nitrososphaerota archaeon]